MPSQPLIKRQIRTIINFIYIYFKNVLPHIFIKYQTSLKIFNFGPVIYIVCQSIKLLKLEALMLEKLAFWQ